MDGPQLTPEGVEQQAKPKLVTIGSLAKKKAEGKADREERRQSFRPDIYWYLTFRCNLACAHCSVQSSPHVDTSQDLTTEECLDVIEQMAELEVRMAMVTGGEFLIRRDALVIMRALADKGIKIGLETNGLRFDTEFVELARELQAQKLLTMTISLDGGTAQTHERLRGPRSFGRTVRGMQFLHDNGVRFFIQCVLNGTNVGTIQDLYELASELSPECIAVMFATLNPVGRGSGLIKEIGLGVEHIPRIFAEISKWQESFPGGTMVKTPPAMIPPKYLPLVFKQSTRVRNPMSCQFPLLGVLPNGDVTVCAVSRNNDELYFGNVRDPGFRLKSTWEKTRMAMLRSDYLAARDLDGICGDCIWKYNCKGSCRAYAYEEGSSFSAPFPICQALDDAGGFPAMYRLSHQNDAAVTRFQGMAAGGCSCST